MKRIFFLFIFIILHACNANTGLKQFYGQQNLILNKKQIVRFINYLNKDFYSYTLKRKVNAYPLMFALSNDGQSSLIIGCEGQGSNFSNECNLGISAYQKLSHFSKISGNKLFIFALEDKIVWGNKTTKFRNIKNYEEFIENEFVIENSSNHKIKLFDHLLSPVDGGACGDEC